MERNEYYDGLNPEELVYDRYLIFIIEAASYCESNQTDHVKRARVKENCDQKLGELTKGVPSEMGGSLDSIMDSQRYEHLFHVTRAENKKHTLIYPHIYAIQEEVKRKKIGNLNYGNDRLARIREGDIVYRSRRPKAEPAVRVSESLTRQTLKARALSDSVQISERLGMVVTRANPKKVSK